MRKRCTYCKKLPHRSIRNAIIYQLKVNTKINIDKPFTVYECPDCDKYLVSLAAAKAYEKENNNE